MKNEPLTLRHRIGLEIARKLNNDLLKEHPLKQLFGNVRCAVTCIAGIAEVTARR